MKDIYYLHVFGRNYPVVKRYFEDIDTLKEFLARLPRHKSRFAPKPSLADEMERSMIVLKLVPALLPNYEQIFIARS